MKSCKGCKYAKWERTNAGRLHPSGDGVCTYKVKLPTLPASRSWLGGAPVSLGGSIERRRELSRHCPCFQPEDV